MALFKKWRARGKGAGEVVETNPHAVDPMAMFKTDRKPYGFEKLSMEQRVAIADTEHEAAQRANKTEVDQAHIQAYMNPGEEHLDSIVDETNRNMSENLREVGTRNFLLNNVSIQDADRMYKANNAAHRAKQREQGVPEHDIMDLESGFEVSGDAMNRLKNGKPAKLSTDSPKK